ncbi:SRPBCC family protein [Pseudonocardiaceae bacterium YIM PH 21723]|nr:SRPBCC family protein [Pseudonocardiaceae bacterium YIM PH 21723]
MKTIRRSRLFRPWAGHMVCIRSSSSRRGTGAECGYGTSQRRLEQMTGPKRDRRTRVPGTNCVRPVAGVDGAPALVLRVGHHQDQPHVAQEKTMIRISLSRRATAPLETVWAVLSDHRGMSKWTPLRSSTLEVEGNPAPNGVGAIRVLKAPMSKIRERVEEFEAPNRLVYTLLSGAPVKDYRAETTLEADGDQTIIRFSITCRPTIPGTSSIVKMVLGTMQGQLIKGLVTESERIAAQG